MKVHSLGHVAEWTKWDGKEQDRDWQSPIHGDNEVLCRFEIVATADHLPTRSQRTSELLKAGPLQLQRQVQINTHVRPWGMQPTRQA